MGNREALLAAAQQCLLNKGYVKTTARDIAAEAGTSLAAIGYHFGSKDALLYQALMHATEKWAKSIENQLNLKVDKRATPMERFETAWTQVIESFENHWRLWTVTLESLPQIVPKTEARSKFAAAIQQAQAWLVDIFRGTLPSLDEKSAHALGSLYYSLLVGTIAQYLIDPQRVPSGADLAHALKTLGESVAENKRSSQEKQPAKRRRASTRRKESAN